MTHSSLVRDITSETFEAILFDNDGTLVDSRATILQAWTSWAIEHGIPAEAFGDVHGRRSRSIIANVAPHLDLDAATADIDRRELDDTSGVLPLPGAAEALAAVGERGAIVTSAGLELATIRLRAADLPLPAVVVSADDGTPGKPDPAPYLLAAQLLGVDPARCLVVEDASAGLQSGRAAGAATLAVETQYGPEVLADYADAIVPDLSQVRFEQVSGGVRVHLIRPSAPGRRWAV